jgi:hypothetical protein
MLTVLIVRSVLADERQSGLNEPGLLTIELVNQAGDIRGVWDGKSAHAQPRR